jgi:hypothetical protein
MMLSKGIEPKSIILLYPTTFEGDLVATKPHITHKMPYSHSQSQDAKQIEEYNKMPSKGIEPPLQNWITPNHSLKVTCKPQNYT